ncbi:alpha/beta hydrolase [Mycolicibacterium sp. YH-1]|uniref:alpha/beta hydrolase n=1 Tax=Mycolicibacterium sp. YH-1 TaxID=2908837 RepID=UPI001F4C31C7|nr:alpha/beta hydrolase [Mycolicibacterium sp. YH-1]UNB49914.1 alpha/beta hydrolase [Mycolicibacterium sp. YH-1]
MTTAHGETESVDRVYTIDGLAVHVTAQGPAGGKTVVLLDQRSNGESPYRAIRERLHIAKVRTVDISADRAVSDKAVIQILDALRVRYAVLVGDRAGAEIGWKTAAHHPQRITGLVVIDRGHPRTADLTGTICDKYCPHVCTDTTVLVSTGAAHSIARASRRYVRGDFRIAELAGRRGSRHFIAQLSTEIVLRTLSL